MPLRNLFKRSGSIQPLSVDSAANQGFTNAPVAGTEPVEPQESVEHELSEIDDNGVFLPPSPMPSKPSFWPTKSTSSISSSNHRSILSDTNEPFSISRESFDSYRRSFDISARAPIRSPSPRRSLDTSLFLAPRPTSRAERTTWPMVEDDDEVSDQYDSSSSGTDSLSRSTSSTSAAEYEQRTSGTAAAAAAFEDVVFTEPAAPVVEAPAVMKRRGLFARFGDEAAKQKPKEAKAEEGGSPTTVLGIGFGSWAAGRKRAQSGQGAELQSMSRGQPMVVVVGE